MREKTIRPSAERACPPERQLPLQRSSWGHSGQPMGTRIPRSESESHSIMHMLPGSASLGYSPGIRIRAATPEGYRFWTSF